MMPKEELETQKAETAEDGNIDKVRDILFGGQVRDFERKLAKLEESVGNQLEGLREDNAKRLDKLEEFVRKEVDNLTGKIFEEKNSRGDAIREVTGEVQKAAGDLESKLAEFGEKTTKNETDIRTQILDQSRTLSDTIQRKQDEIFSSMERETSELRDDKADRAALADLFTEMAMRLTGEFKIPDSE